MLPRPVPAPLARHRFGPTSLGRSRGPRRAAPGPLQARIKSHVPSRRNTPFGLGKDHPFAVCGRGLPGATIGTGSGRARHYFPLQGTAARLFRAPYRKVNALDQRNRFTDRGRCGHDALPVEVLPVVGGKKIAHCPECGRSGPAREGSAGALAALRGTPPDFPGPGPHGTGVGSGRQWTEWSERYSELSI